MSICPLEKAIQDYNKKEKEIKNILSITNGLISKWTVNNDSFFILSKCAKKEGFQLTYFRNNIPIYDMIRGTYDDRDIIDELIIDNVNIDTINYIY